MIFSDVNTLSGLDNWRSKDTSSSNNRGPGEFKSMKNFDEPSKQIQRTVSYKSEKSIPAKIVRNFASTFHLMQRINCTIPR